MKNLIITLFLMLMLLGCKEDCKRKSIEMYQKNSKKLTQTVDVNGINMRLSFFPSYALPGASRISQYVSDTSSNYYYYFRFELVTGPSVEPVKGQEILYRLDNLFVVTDSIHQVFPVLVQPIIKGGSRNVEYLLVFEKSAVDNCKDNLFILFNDRFYTGKVQKFAIDKKMIFLLETLSC